MDVYCVFSHFIVEESPPLLPLTENEKLKKKCKSFKRVRAEMDDFNF